MIDLIRLMSDDPAVYNKPVSDPGGRYPSFEVVFKAVKYRATYVEAENYINRGHDITSTISFYGWDSRCPDNTMWGIRWLLQDPTRYLREWCPHMRGLDVAASANISAYNIRDGIVWYRFERIS